MKFVTKVANGTHITSYYDTIINWLINSVLFLSEIALKCIEIVIVAGSQIQLKLIIWNHCKLTSFFFSFFVPRIR